ncbi:hypothetical protein [Acuticoccus mangrovi]|nr:hypothetical protein [Acuticoccus mangrovi]
MNAITAGSISLAVFLLALAGALWTETGGALFAAMVEAGYVLCQ